MHISTNLPHHLSRIFLGLLCLLHLSICWSPAEYPPYCSKNMTEREIPPLNTTNSNLELKQLQVLIRHGARTPYAYFYCWEDYAVTWNCNVTELMVSKSPLMV